MEMSSLQVCFVSEIFSDHFAGVSLLAVYDAAFALVSFVDERDDVVYDHLVLSLRGYHVVKIRTVEGLCEYDGILHLKLGLDVFNRH